jgi:serine/threonine-protein kinase
VTREQAALGAKSPTKAPAEEELLPRQFGKYILLSRLSAGGIAESFLGLQRSTVALERLVVIKRILPAMNQDRTFIDMLLHEARIAASLSHPNIVRTFDAGEIDGTYFIAVEHIPGEDLHVMRCALQKRGRGEMPLAHALAIMLGVCAGLSYLHEKRDLGGIPLGIVHHDISTRNIIVSFSGDVKVVNFGMAKSDTDEGEDRKDRPINGKTPYMSPEQVMGEVIDWRTDIFTAGLLLFEMTTGRRLFAGESEVDTLLMIRDSNYTRPSQIQPGYPAALERIVMRALQKRREDRYQSAREMQADLEAFVHDERIAISRSAIAEWMQSLFEEKTARYKEARESIEQIVSAIAAQQKRWTTDAGSGGTSPSAPSSAPANTNPSAMHLPASPRANLTAVIPAASVIALALWFFYMQHETSVRQAELLRMYREELGVRREVSPATAEGRGSLEITSKPSGCAIWLNGELRSEVTPAHLDNLPLGRELHIKLTKDGFEAYRTSVRLSEDAPFKDINAELQKSPATLHF